MIPPEARLTGDEEIDALPMPSWWDGEEAAAADGRRAMQELAALRPVSDE